VASVLAVPVTLLCAASGLLFGWELGFALAISGSLAAAVIGYGLGRVLWRDWVTRVSGRRLFALNRALASGGVLAVAGLRIVPVAPFAVVNVLAGATRVRLTDFVLGTLLAMAPGSLAIALFADSALFAWRRPSGLALAGAAACAIALFAGAFALRRWLARRSAPREHVVRQRRSVKCTPP
jgi:uncharacterized membrane protein YdjX (TVP38/TMEM64 family)